MTGRGIDQILSHSCPPEIHEPVMTSAVGYVELAERIHGPLPDRVGWKYVWGDALEALDEARPDLRILNLETAVTLSEDFLPKGINYRMHPGNVPVLEAVGADACVLANNHVLDWGGAGLRETLSSLGDAGLPTPGAGLDLEEASDPAVLEMTGGEEDGPGDARVGTPEKPRVLLFGVGAEDAGVPPGWAATRQEPGVHLLPDYSAPTVETLADRIRMERRPGDVVVVSVHWGGNWGYRIPDEHRRFGRGLVEAGVDVVHGHSSHHPRAIEVHRGRPIFYGCGDFLNDYEGIGGRESFRSEIVLMYLLTLDPGTGEMVRLEMHPFRIRRFRLNHPTADEVGWIHARMDRECRRFGRGVRREGERTLALDASALDDPDGPP